MTSKIRLARVVIQLEAFAVDDDTLELTQLPLDRIVLDAKGIPEWYSITLPEELAKLERQLNDTDEITSDLTEGE